MKNYKYRKILILGIITLVLGASILPIVGSKQFNHEKTGNENPESIQIIWSFMSSFNITFYGNATRGTELSFGIIIANSAVCTDTSVQPIAELTWTSLGKKTESIEINNTMVISFFLILPRDFDTNMEPNVERSDGYITGSTFLFGVYF